MDTLFVMQRASSRAEFWFVLLLTPAIALLPRYNYSNSVAIATAGFNNPSLPDFRIVAKVLLQELSPTPVMAARARRKAKTTEIDVTKQLELRTSTES